MEVLNWNGENKGQKEILWKGSNMKKKAWFPQGTAASAKLDPWNWQ